MPHQALFAGLVVDEFDRRVGTALVGDEPCHVVDDAGFNRHIPAEQVDRVVLSQIAELMKGSEDLISEQTAKMIPWSATQFFLEGLSEELSLHMDPRPHEVLSLDVDDMRSSFSVKKAVPSSAN